MSYFKFMEYSIIPVESFRVIRKCSGCGCKSIFVNTNCFRINANGKDIDVWLIYQCSKCRHTYNLSIYERVKPHSINQEEYLKLLENDLETAFNYGVNLAFMEQNKAEVDWKSIKYEIVGTRPQDGKDETTVTIYNPYALKIRTDKALSEIMGISRQEIKKMLLDHDIYITNKNLGEKSEITTRLH